MKPQSKWKTVVGIALEIGLLLFFVVMVVLGLAAAPYLIARRLYERVDAWQQRWDRS